MRSTIATVAAFAFAVAAASATGAVAKQCKDPTTGKFVQCSTVTTSATATKKSTRCKDTTTGKYVKCPAGMTTSSAAVTTRQTTSTMAAATPKPATGQRCRNALGAYVKCGATNAPGLGRTIGSAPATAAGAASRTVGSAAATATAPTRAYVGSAPGTFLGAPAGATARCKDGTYSMSKTHSGTCSRHGGVSAWLKQ
jgi:hypothetical protein